MINQQHSKVRDAHRVGALPTDGSLNELVNARQSFGLGPLGGTLSFRGATPSRLASEEFADVDAFVRQGVAAQRVPDSGRETVDTGNPVLDFAQQITSDATAARADLASRALQAAARGPLINKLKLAVQGARFENWDGYGGRPASPAAYDSAVRFAVMLPPTLPDPEASVDSDGDISFEWYRGPRQVFSVSVSSSGTLHYAGLFGLNNSHGAETLSETVPDAIALGLARVLREPTAL